jgi:UPF0755 protein
MMNKALKIIGIFSLAAAAISVALFVYWRHLSAPVNLTAARGFTVEVGDSLEAISLRAEQAGLIRSASAFKLYAKVSGLAPAYKAGNFAFSGPVSLESLSSALVAGDKQSNTVRITVPEGYAIRDIDAHLAKNGLSVSGEFSRRLASPDFLATARQTYDFLADEKVLSLEGYLFPDTYDVYKDVKPEELARKMLDNFERKLKPEWLDEIKRQGKSLQDMVIMASLVEKEVRKVEDMKMVADIFWRRLDNGQAFESCATLAYVLGVNKPQYSLEDTQVDSPYNTYRHKGLPPGPIANPGLNAIEAAIFPLSNNYNFFLTARDGRTIFSASFEEHVANKNKYLK